MSCFAKATDARERLLLLRAAFGIVLAARNLEPLTDGGDVGLPLNDAGALLAHAHEDGVAYVLSACEVPCSMVEILGQSSLHPTSRCDLQE